MQSEMETKTTSTESEPAAQVMMSAQDVQNYLEANVEQWKRFFTGLAPQFNEQMKNQPAAQIWSIKVPLTLTTPSAHGHEKAWVEFVSHGGFSGSVECDSNSLQLFWSTFTKCVASKPGPTFVGEGNVNINFTLMEARLLKEGSKLNARDTVKKWYTGEVIKSEHERLLIHYEGCSTVWNEWIERFSCRLARYNPKAVSDGTLKCHC